MSKKKGELSWWEKVLCKLGFHKLGESHTIFHLTCARCGKEELQYP